MLHYFWLAKVGVHGPYYYALWLALVLGVRVVDAVRRAAARARRGAARETALAPGLHGPPEPRARRARLPARARLCYRDRARARWSAERRRDDGQRASWRVS